MRRSTIELNCVTVCACIRITYKYNKGYRFKFAQEEYPSVDKSHQ